MERLRDQSFITAVIICILFIRRFILYQMPLIVEYKKPEKLFQWIRSSDMTYIKMLIHETAIHDFVDKIGCLNCVQFTDMNYADPPMKQEHVNDIKRCNGINMKINWIESMLNKYNVEMESILIDDFVETIQSEKTVTNEYIMENLESLIEKREKELREVNEYIIKISQEYLKKVEMRFILEMCGRFFMNRNEDFSARNKEKQDEEMSHLKFDYIIGVIEDVDRSIFERVVMRITRGNVLIRFFSIPVPLIDPETGNPVKKSVFVIFYHSAIIAKKVSAVMDAYNVHVYPISDLQDKENVKSMYSTLMTELEDSERVANKSIDKCRDILQDVAKYIQAWKWTVEKEKCVNDVMNKFKREAGGSLYGEGWIQNESLAKVQEICECVHYGKGTTGYVEVLEEPSYLPPTSFKVNQFTALTQTMVDTYGVPDYKEVNPAVFTLITFPFQFGIMFGDMGHALLLTAFSLFLILYENQLKKSKLNELVSMIFSGRYVLIMMGACAIYVGFLYNDQFALGIDWFKTTWHFYNGSQIGTWDGRVYPVGLDPIWHGKSNELLFYNSFKMKFAVTFGVSQMVLGVLLKVKNNIYFGHWLDLFSETLPQLLFLLSFFGWMIFLIIYKWLVNWDKRMLNHESPPQLINTLINMVLSPGVVVDPMFPQQGTCQLLALFIAIVSIPWMLLIKPIYLSIHYKKQRKAIKPKERQEKNPSLHYYPEETTSLSELIIFQGIETIEYCLGCISHTASYLRLWALSLAHSQLSIVLWDNILLRGLNSDSNMNGIGIFVLFIIYFLATIAILLIMDSLECYLHALRLHWVEFQTKFYKGNGFKFTPLDFHSLLVGDE